MDKITFDFESGTISFVSGEQRGELVQPDLIERKGAIIEAAGLEIIPLSELRQEINKMFTELGFTNLRCAEPNDDDKN